MAEQKEDRAQDDFTPMKDSGLTALQGAYNSREVSLSMLLVGAVVVAMLAGVLVALVLFSGGA